MDTYPVIESFGLTIQGEGINAGRRAWFVRMAGCDCDCPWCDTRYAREVSAGVPQSSKVALAGFRRLPITMRENALVVLTGGNPFLYDCTALVGAARDLGASVAAETQGTIYQDWAGQLDHLAISPKMNCHSYVATGELINAVIGGGGTAELKIVAVDEETYEWAVQLHGLWPHVPFTLQALSEDGVPQQLSYWAERFAGDSRWNTLARFLPQIHTLIWGNIKGV